MAKSDFNLMDFKAAIKANGVARNTRFEIVFYPPEALVGKINEREISIRCNTGALPPMNVKTRDYMVGQGQLRKMPYTYDHGHQLDFTFYNDNKSKVYDGLLQWSKMIKASQGASEHSIRYYNEYTGSVLVKQLNEIDNVIYQYTLVEAYPIVVDTVHLDSAQVNESQIVKITFAYRFAVDGIRSENLIEWKEKTTAAIKRNNTYDVDATVDPTMTTISKKGKGLPKTYQESYNECKASSNQAYSAGEQAYNNQRQMWGDAATSMNNAFYTGGISNNGYGNYPYYGNITSQNKSLINDVWETTKSAYNYVSSSVSDFFSNTVDAVSKYAEISNSVPTDDPLHTDMTALQNTYNQVSSTQIEINDEYQEMSDTVDAINNSTSITV